MNTRTRISRRDEGSAAVEVTLATPLLVFLALAGLAAHHLISAAMVADSAAHAAARAATLERTVPDAQAAASIAAADVATQNTTTCSTHEMAADLHGLGPGAVVEATVTCQVDLTVIFGLTLPVTGSGTAVVDRYRGAP
ncbi:MULTISPECIES: TadE/TadG family type IV pilus assembly protein [Nocardiopsis]|uniref:Flp pilus assembly protein TadG n=2 Tax=Nocardiopsis TaxID=2013 RepID=A0A840WNU7_9ACTN|nr:MULTISPECIES: TadE/TadG family type IV pilus assembly protein [Nocardiopsis]MBB5493426.1 Flp pilus assembly protein TadG [Nocardiopsis metallicus]MEE2051638.1 TadE/TadG family type IV pilus assembly protein [Nocardiopsis umidischolae]